MNFRTRLHTLQNGCRLGLLFIACGLAGIWIPSASPIIFKCIFGIGCALGLYSSLTLAATQCPACDKPFCSSKNESEEAKTSVFAATCQFCGYIPEE